MGVDLILAGIYVEEKSLFKEKIVVSTVGVNLILAGIYAEEKSLFKEKIVPVAIHKNTKKRKATLSILV